jgi:hypothetical protein
MDSIVLSSFRVCPDLFISLAELLLTSHGVNPRAPYHWTVVSDDKQLLSGIRGEDGSIKIHLRVKPYQSSKKKKYIRKGFPGYKRPKYNYIKKGDPGYKQPAYHYIPKKMQKKPEESLPEIFHHIPIPQLFPTDPLPPTVVENILNARPMPEITEIIANTNLH